MSKLRGGENVRVSKGVENVVHQSEESLKRRLVEVGTNEGGPKRRVRMSATRCRTIASPTLILIPSEVPCGRVGLLVHAQKRPSLTHPPFPRRRRSAASNWTTRPGPVSRRRTTAPSKPASTSAAKDYFTFPLVSISGPTSTFLSTSRTSLLPCRSWTD